MKVHESIFSGSQELNISALVIESWQIFQNAIVVNMLGRQTKSIAHGMFCLHFVHFDAEI